MSTTLLVTYWETSKPFSLYGEAAPVRWVSSVLTTSQVLQVEAAVGASQVTNESQASCVSQLNRHGNYDDSYYD